MLQLYLKAPFAACRPFVAGAYRPSAPFLTPSAAFGLLFNLAGINMRTEPSWPELEIAMGTVKLHGSTVLIQQLHNYPIGETGKEHRERCKGNKYNIQPIRREILVDLEAWLFVRAEPEILAVIRDGLLGDSRNQANAQPRYGLPFIGDNNFLIDRLEERPVSQAIHWFYQVDLNQVESTEIPPLFRLTIEIDRTSMTKTRTALFTLSPSASLSPPVEAWLTLRKEASTEIIKQKCR